MCVCLHLYVSGCVRRSRKMKANDRMLIIFRARWWLKEDSLYYFLCAYVFENFHKTHVLTPKQADIINKNCLHNLYNISKPKKPPEINLQTFSSWSLCLRHLGVHSYCVLPLGVVWEVREALKELKEAL